MRFLVRRKELLEKTASIEKQAFCGKEGDVKNGFYERDMEDLCGKIQDLKVPRTREGGFRPFFIMPYKRVYYEIEDLIIAMYQGGWSTRDVSRTMIALLDRQYSPSWLSRITDVVQEKEESIKMGHGKEANY
mgnify:CR=1 FL=1